MIEQQAIKQAAPAHVRAMAPYQAGKPIEELARELGLDPATIVKLASNENPLGMPASAKRAIAAALEDLARYPDDNGFSLKAAISARCGVPAEWITLGNGSSDILSMAAAAVLMPGRSAIFSQYSFAIYALATQARGATSIEVAAKNFGHDLDAMAAAIRPDTALIFLTNPNNPTGTYLSGAAIEAFLEQVPAHVLVVLDEAYNEYLPPELKTDGLGWVKRFPNLLVSRTFSKAFALAGLRVGYGIAQPGLIDLLQRVRQPFNVNAVAQAAAVAALADEDFIAQGYELNRTGLTQLTAAFDRLGLEYVPSFGNFILFKVGAADRINRELLARGVIVRPVANYGLPEWLRVTVGLATENQRFIAALEQALAVVRG